MLAGWSNTTATSPSRGSNAANRPLVVGKARGAGERLGAAVATCCTGALTEGDDADGRGVGASVELSANSVAAISRNPSMPTLSLIGHGHGSGVRVEPVLGVGAFGGTAPSPTCDMRTDREGVCLVDIVLRSAGFIVVDPS